MVGGKALNLSKLASAGFPIPEGFFIPTSSYLDFIRQNNLDTLIQSVLDYRTPIAPDDLEKASTRINQAFSTGKVRENFIAALEHGWCWLGKSPVAVRSSATTEDLPEASFAGQHDTFLNVVSIDKILQAVVSCWSSLWSARAISYRDQYRIPHETAAICVVVQKMIFADASGVMFTANPLTGLRSELVIEATLGLGEALVSGNVIPDHYIVSVKRRSSHLFDRDKLEPEVKPIIKIQKVALGSKGVKVAAAVGGGVTSTEIEASQEQALSEPAILSLARIGLSINRFYGHPQDIEWAYEKGKRPIEQSEGISILQSRPVTSLFPLPENLTLEPPRFLVGFHTVQGVFDPITPLGQETLKLLVVGAGRLFGVQRSLERQTALYSAAERLWINFTPILKTPTGYKFFPRMIKEIDPGVGDAVNEVITDPRFAPIYNRTSLKTIWRVLRFIGPVLRQVVHVLKHPDKERQAVLDIFDTIVSQTIEAQTPSGKVWLDFQQNLELLLGVSLLFSDFVIPRGIPLIIAGVAPFYGIISRLWDQASETFSDSSYRNLWLEIARGLPHNVTTEMDLALWDIAVRINRDAQSATCFRSDPASNLANAFLASELPKSAQDAIQAFIQRYGQRGPGEIDLGKKRWEEEPTPVMRALKGYLKITDPEKAPDVVFAHGKVEARNAVETMAKIVAGLRFGWFKVRLLRFAVSRYRALAGMREAPKFFAVRMMGIMRQGLLASGEALAKAGIIEDPEDLFFLHINELSEISDNKTISEDHKASINVRRKKHEQEKLRSRLPLLLFSDGKVIYQGGIPRDEESLRDDSDIRGSPVSPGVVEGRVRVVLDPHHAGLEPGEILVCLGTDPSWTPLFLSAGGLIMEVGGMMTHGSVVAREYGIPAVVGISDATTRLKTGSFIRLDANTGRVILLE
jgi:pyruvate,water dikinase